MEKLLTQEEVDALLKGVSEGNIETEVCSAQEAVGVRAYDFASQERIIRGRMPTMEIIHERFSKDATASLFRFIGRTAEVTAQSFELLKFGEFLRKLPVPSSVNVFRTDPFRGSSLFFFDAKFTFLVMDILFGGPGTSRTKIEGRNLTAIENRIIRRLLDLVLDDLRKAWSIVEEMSFRCVRSELNPQLANIAAPTDIVLAAIFQIELELERATMGYCIPYSTVEPFKDLLHGRFQSECTEIDPKWRQRISENLRRVPLEVSVELGTCEASLRNILSLQVGDLLHLDGGPDDPMTLKIQDNAKGTCQAGQRNGRCAVEVHFMHRNLNKERRLGKSTRSREIQNAGRSQLEGSLFQKDSGGRTA